MESTSFVPNPICATVFRCEVILICRYFPPRSCPQKLEGIANQKSRPIVGGACFWDVIWLVMPMLWERPGCMKKLALSTTIPSAPRGNRDLSLIEFEIDYIKNLHNPVSLHRHIEKNEVLTV